MLQTDVDDPDFGKIPLDWEGPVGMVLAIRVDHGEAEAFIRCLAHYCMDRVYPRLQRALKTGMRWSKVQSVRATTSLDFEMYRKLWE